MEVADKWFFLSKAKVRWLFNYYKVLILLGLILVVYTLVDVSNERPMKLTITVMALIGGIGASLIGCAIFYLRKLYKASINKEMCAPTTDDHEYREMGIFAYYKLRPIFSVIFSLLIHVLLKSSVNIVTVKETALDDGFVYLNIVLSFFVGFASGDVITFIEAKSKDVVETTLNRHL